MKTRSILSHLKRFRRSYIGGALLLVAALAFAATNYGVLRFADAAQIRLSCVLKGGSPEKCYNVEFRTYAREHGPLLAFDTLHALFSLDEGATGCHFIAHGIGYGTYENDPEHWTETFRNVSQECSYGAMHGILELAVANNGGLSKKTMPEICGETPRADCNHIVGHLTLVQSAGSVTKALDLCSVFTDPTQYDHCSSGVFMEEETATNLVVHGLADESYLDWPKRAPELSDLCRAQNSRDAVMCWKELAHVFVAASAGDAAGTFARCADNAPSEKAQEECLTHSIGILVSETRFDLEGMQGVCTAYGTYGDMATCHVHAISSLLATLPNGVPFAIRYCAAVPADEAPNLCFASIGNGLMSGPRDAAGRAKVCESAPEEFQALCRSGGNSILVDEANYDKTPL